MSHPPIVKTTQWPNEQATAQFAGQLAKVPALRNCLITLQGDLGSGKTTLIRHLLHACGITGRIKSPTYALLESYELDGWAIWHFDFYRFEDPREWDDAGFRELFGSAGLKLVEWPQRVAGLLPQADLAIELSVLPNAQRSASLCAHTPAGAALLTALSAGLIA